MRGQASTEYLFLLGLLLVVLIPVLYYSFHKVHADVQEVQLEELVMRLQQSINVVHRLGTESQEVIEVHVPSRVVGLSASNTKEFTVLVTASLGNASAVASVGIPVFPQVVGKFDVNPGLHRIRVKAVNETMVNATDVIFIP